MKSHKLIELLRLESEEIDTAFQKASLEGKGTPQEVADRREEVVKVFFEKYFPFPFRIVKGNIVDINENSSNSIDCIILNPSHPYTVDKTNGRPSIVFADATDFAIEIKPDLSSKNEVERALVQITSVKKLTRHDGSRINSVIFSNRTNESINTLVNNVAEYYINNDIDYKYQFDIIYINKRGLLVNYNNESEIKISNNCPYGIYFIETKVDSMGYLLKLMNSARLSEMRMRKSILVPYLEKYLPNGYNLLCCYKYENIVDSRK